MLVVSSATAQSKGTVILRNGANDFISKPYDNDELIVRFSNLAENKKNQEQANKNSKKSL
jgi:DNA-binding response OmpR family regulator